ncbi:sulfurtransferase TusA family protein [Kordiimonas laminariae]|uniref:sulfurtransferase TusA family protein n=1 Tax=Kordiimonas laminariae TaxID=2917717 RepID=UPI003CCFE0C3
MPSATQQNALNLIGTSCPMAFVKARMHIDQLPNSAVTVIVFEDTPANEPLIRSIEALGHTVLSKTQFESTDDTVPNSDASSRSGTLHVIRVEIQVKI